MLNISMVDKSTSLDFDWLHTYCRYTMRLLGMRQAAQENLCCKVSRIWPDGAWFSPIYRCQYWAEWIPRNSCYGCRTANKQTTRSWVWENIVFDLDANDLGFFFGEKMSTAVCFRNVLIILIRIANRKEQIARIPKLGYRCQNTADHRISICFVCLLTRFNIFRSVAKCSFRLDV